MTVALHPAPAAATQLPTLQRAVGHVRVAFKRGDDGRTRLADLFQDGAGKARLPRDHDGGPVAVLINSAGGLTGGDVFDVEAHFGPGTRAQVTTQAAERIYRRRDGRAKVTTRITVGAGARAAWLPQETIVFEGAGLDRRLDIDLGPDARLLVIEALLLGRTAMGEEIHRIDLIDRWRVSQRGRLVFADALRLEGDATSVMAGGATGAGARAIASILLMGPDAEARLDAVRDVLEVAAGTDSGVEAGASAFDGRLVIRLIGQTGQALRSITERLLPLLNEGPLPRVWAL